MMNMNYIMNGTKKSKSKPKDIMGSNFKRINLTGFETKGMLIGKDIGINLKGMQSNKATKHNNLSAKSILGGMDYKPMKSNFSVNKLMSNAKPKKYKTLIPKYNIVNDSLLNQFRKPAKRHTTILGDKITKPQRKVLNKKSIIPRFGDWDKDGVINALDCEPRNPMKHGFLSKIKEKLSQDRVSERKSKQEAGLAKYRMQSAESKMQSAKLSIRDRSYSQDMDIPETPEQSDYLKKKHRSDKHALEIERRKGSVLKDRLGGRQLENEEERLEIYKGETADAMAVRDESKPYQKAIKDFQLKSAEIESKAGIPQKTRRYIDAKEKYENLNPENYNNTKEYEKQLKGQIKKGIKQKQKEIDRDAGFGFEESLKKAESEKAKTREQEAKYKEQEKIIKESRKEQISEQKERDRIKNKKEKELKSKLNQETRFKKMQDAGVKIRQPFTKVKEGFQNIETAFSKTPEEQKRELERQQAKLEKNAPKIEAAFNKYSPYVSKSLYEKYKRADKGNFSLGSKRAMAEAGRKEKIFQQQKEEYSIQQRRLSLLKAKQDYRTMKKLAPAETRQRKGYLNLLSNQTQFNMEQLARQRAEAKSREQEQMRIRQIRNLQQRQQRYYQNQEANKRAFNTEPGEGLSVFFTDGIPNQPPTTQSRFKFL